MGTETLGKLLPVICLDTLNGTGKSFHQMFQKQGGGVGTVFLESLHKAPSGKLIDGGILEELLTDNPAVYKAGGGDKFPIHLDTLSGVIHLLIGLKDTLGVRWMDSHNVLSFEELVKVSNGVGVAALGEFDPEKDKSGMRITPAHVRDEFYLIRGVLVRVVMRSV